MSVMMCLNGLDQDNWDVKTDVYIPCRRQPAPRGRRALLRALCLSAEVIFKIEEGVSQRVDILLLRRRTSR